MSIQDVGRDKTIIIKEKVSYEKNQDSLSKLQTENKEILYLQSTEQQDIARSAAMSMNLGLFLLLKKPLQIE